LGTHYLDCAIELILLLPGVGKKIVQQYKPFKLKFSSSGTSSDTSVSSSFFNAPLRVYNQHFSIHFIVTTFHVLPPKWQTSFKFNVFEKF
jgi:hypothetical protein